MIVCNIIRLIQLFKVSDRWRAEKGVSGREGKKRRGCGETLSLTYVCPAPQWDSRGPSLPFESGLNHHL